MGTVNALIKSLELKPHEGAQRVDCNILLDHWYQQTGKAKQVCHTIDHYHVTAISDLKQGWTGIKNVHTVFSMHIYFKFIVYARPALFQIQNSSRMIRVRYLTNLPQKVQSELVMTIKNILSHKTAKVSSFYSCIIHIFEPCYQNS